jgi:hypothetical protein
MSAHSVGSDFRLTSSFALNRFESWWTHLKGDISLFASCKPDYRPIFLRPPFSAQTRRTLSSLPLGFGSLAEGGKIATDTIALIANIVSYETAYRGVYTRESGSDVSCSPGTQTLLRHFATLSTEHGYEDFYQAASCMLVVGAHFEKCLVFALMLYVSLAYAPDPATRMKLACSHTVFRAPRTCLTRDLPTIRLPSPDLVEDAPSDFSKVYTTLRDCHIWIWLILISSWMATDGVHSERARKLSRLFKRTWGRYAKDWRFLDSILNRFFSTQSIRSHLKQCWNDI